MRLRPRWDLRRLSDAPRDLPPRVRGRADSHIAARAHSDEFRGVPSSFLPDNWKGVPMTDRNSPLVTNVLVVAVPVLDQERARDFYVDVLGFEKHEDVVVGDGFRWVELRPAGSPVGVALVPVEPDVPAGVVDTG